MAGQIIVNYGTFDAHAKTITTINDSLLQKLHDIQNLITSLEGDYESDSAVEIRENIIGMEKHFQSYYNVVDNYAKFLRNTAAEYRATEKTNTANAKEFKK